MKVLFVYPNVATGNGLHYQHGIGMLSASLRANGHETALLDLEELPEPGSFLEAVGAEKPGLVAFSFGSHQWSHVRRFSSLVKDELGLPTLAGGVHATHAPEETIEHPGIDLLCRGEGEQAMVEAADALDRGLALDNIANLWVKRNGGVVRNEVRPLIEDLDTLPFSDRAIFDMDRILAVNAHEMSLMAGRGCPYGCYYCCNNALIKLYKGKGRYVRFRSVDHVLAEVEALAERYRIDTLYFEDDIFTLKKAWVDEFCEKYPKRFSFPFRIYLHVEAVDRGMLARLKDIGLYKVNVGVESGSERIRREAMNRRMPNERIVQVFDWLHDLDIAVRDFNIVGLPGETPETMRETIALNERILPDEVQVAIFYPYRGTRLYDVCQEAGYLTGEERQTFFEDESILDLPDLPRSEIKAAYREFCAKADEIGKRRVAADLEKGASGYYDFLSHEKEREIEYGEADLNRIDRFLIGGERRFVLFSHPRSKVTYRGVPVRKDARLRFAMALDPKCLDWGGGAVVFRVVAANGDGEVELFRDSIDPKHDPAQRAWHDREVDLSRFADGPVDLSFLTDPDESGDLTGAWAGWARPHLVSGDGR